MPTEKKDRLPHTRRDMSARCPHHVVMTFRAGVPKPSWRKVHGIFERVVRLVRDRLDASVGIACSMSDHVHMVVETRPGGASLGDVMRFLASKLALGINRAFGRSGPVYRDRYFSRPLKSLSELVRAIRYVGMNPVKARLVQRPEHFATSSVRDYLVRNPSLSPWRTHGWMYRQLGFDDNPRTALQDILEDRRLPVVARGGRQFRLPFAKGLPAR